MQVNIGQASLRNPVILSAGTSGVMGEIGDAIDLHSIGGLTTKSITAEARVGNEPIRIADVPNGMMNAIGLANEGIASFIQEHAQKASSLPTTVIGSIAGDSIASYVQVASAMNGVDGIELVEVNVSCPNTEDGLEFGACPKQLSFLLKEIRPALSKSGMLVKLSIASGDIRPHAEAAMECGADGLTLINTIPSLAIDVETKQPILSRGIGGLSGGEIHPVAVRVVYEIYRDVTKGEIPIIGTGGVMKWEDAAEFILAGANAVGIGTALFANPAIAPKVAKGLHAWVYQQGCEHVNDLVGAVHHSL